MRREGWQTRRAQRETLELKEIKNSIFDSGFLVIMKIDFQSIPKVGENIFQQFVCLI